MKHYLSHVARLTTFYCYCCSTIWRVLGTSILIILWGKQYKKTKKKLPKTYSHSWCSGKMLADKNALQANSGLSGHAAGQGKSRRESRRPSGHMGSDGWHSVISLSTGARSSTGSKMTRRWSTALKSHLVLWTIFISTQYSEDTPNSLPYR